jgi:hypothetical protein
MTGRKSPTSSEVVSSVLAKRSYCCAPSEGKGGWLMAWNSITQATDSTESRGAPVETAGFSDEPVPAWKASFFRPYLSKLSSRIRSLVVQS